MKQPNIVVVGSLNADLVTQSEKIPRRGETVLGEEFSTFLGGKGANQAVACARLGANVSIIGCVGDDFYGASICEDLKKENINIVGIDIKENTSSGIAAISVSQGDNQIIVVPGANKYTTPEKVTSSASLIREADIMLLQLEIPYESVQKAINLAHTYDIPVILNPAPAMTLSNEMIDNVDYLTPNEHELSIIWGDATEGYRSFHNILRAYPEKLIVTKGADGTYFADKQKNIKNRRRLLLMLLIQQEPEILLMAL